MSGTAAQEERAKWRANERADRLAAALSDLAYMMWGPPRFPYPRERAGADGVVWTSAESVRSLLDPDERQVTALSGALSAVGDDLGEALRKSEIYRLGLADAAARANTAEAQRDQAWRNLDTAHDDIAALLRESGLGDYARPVSTHDVIRDELLPWVRRAARALDGDSR